MGYTTRFKGSLSFTCEMSDVELAYLNTFLNHELPQDHDDWIKPDGNISYIQWEVTPDKKGIQWDGSEKFYDSVKSVNLIIENMKNKFPDFGFEGQMMCAGESVDDIWRLGIVFGKAVCMDETALSDTMPGLGDAVDKLDDLKI